MKFSKLTYVFPNNSVLHSNLNLKLLSLNRSYLPYFYKLKTGRDGKTGKDFYMYINWNKDTHKEVFGLAKATRFREVKKIYFIYIKEEESKEVLEYLVSNCPLKLRIFAFDAGFGFIGNGDFYLKGIEKVRVLVV